MVSGFGLQEGGDDFVDWLVAMLGFWIITSINSLFILTVDFSRTNTYLGCFTVQTALNLGLAIANLVNLLHHRNGVAQFICPSETRTYALVRNSFAAAAMGILLWRTITALLKAENAISTRVVSSTCGLITTNVHFIHILAERPTYGANSTYGDVEIDVSVSQADTKENWEPSSTYKYEPSYSRKMVDFIFKLPPTVVLFG
ncbi:transmembrane protein, putative, partial [Rhizoctonia solani AG-3 Rhs1AP]